MDKKNNVVKCKHTHWLVVVVFLVICSSVFSFSQSWAPVEKECPMCGTKSTYYDMLNFGSYIYHYPSKYEYVFWPYTDNKVLYCCRKCWFTCFAWDFDSIPEDKHEEIQEILDRLAVFETDGTYYVIPMYYRLLIAEEIYKLLDKDDDFWCRLYRVKGYHLAQEKKTASAAEARGKAYALAEKMIQEPKNIGIRKELYYITGAMKYLLNDTLGALDDFKTAQQLTYMREGWDEKSNTNVDNYLSNLIQRYITKITMTSEDYVLFSATPTIAQLVSSPKIFVDSLITVPGICINQGKGYFKDFKPAMKDHLGNIVSVVSWVPLEVPPPRNPDAPRPRVMSDFLNKRIKVTGYLRKDTKDNLVEEHYLEVINAEILSE